MDPVESILSWIKAQVNRYKYRTKCEKCTHHQPCPIGQSGKGYAWCALEYGAWTMNIVCTFKVNYRNHAITHKVSHCPRFDRWKREKSWVSAYDNQEGAATTMASSLVQLMEITRETTS